MSSWLAENPELLEAALEIVDTWDVGYVEPKLEPSVAPVSEIDSGTDDAASTTSTGSHSSRNSVATSPRLPKLVVTPTKVELSVAPSRRRLQPATLKSTHHRRREEIHALTRNVAELERELKTLTRTKRDNGGHPMTENGESDGARVRVWRDAAIRQQRLRSAAESERAKLRARLDAQAAVARGMVKLIQKARRLEDDETARSLKRQRFVSRQVSHLEGSDQLVWIQDMYSNLDRVLSHPKFHDGTMKFIDIKMHEDRPLQFVVELSEAWVVPFAQDHVMDALWKYSYKRHTDGMCAPEFVLDAEVQVNEDELVSRFTAFASIESSQGYFEGRAVAKRFARTEKSPPVIITSMGCTPSVSSPGDFIGVQNRGLSSLSVWDTGDRDQPVSRVAYTERFTLTFDDTFNSRHHASLITSSTLQKLKNNVERMHEIVETVLLTA